jgi:hypothetical protein
MDERPTPRKSPTSMSEPLADRRAPIVGAALLGASTAMAAVAAAPAPPSFAPKPLPFDAGSIAGRRRAV